ncbi:Sphingomyelin phosphodiesterase 2, neutral membrane (Neutral sphingomyelinase) [Cichlidogyrus casuarinus]|uniref:Sphingomyelin phosphodiesterase 2, neutral membrane (Neutral sphingomyelinase) n=1 Tax=Cichlidogyrus casuarinus TaxID=1844966 RepID=A0ABD2Q0S3_9PLAT
MLNAQSLLVPLLLVTIGFVLAGLATSSWHCGNLFTTCGHDLTNIIQMILLCGGLLLLMLVFCMEALGMCADNWVPGPVCGSFKIVMLLVGAGSILAASIMYTWAHDPRWSPYFVIIGSVCSVHIALLALISCRCIKS